MNVITFLCQAAQEVAIVRLPADGRDKSRHKPTAECDLTGQCPARHLTTETGLSGQWRARLEWTAVDALDMAAVAPRG